eukprot:CAMPEP_0115617714 /NCGR_PEP_ID=MMETSP0272-20121206/23784_1 /TAXON_ID=71861 /ORGANISM="Scrippsiella trochoidea, Strain CCMP3099" /LENGTH=672 /DNA_ID=CAMNT_0003053673 /DNA_START=16 /DNA_END=2033 /DNA_ORIENTATION=+
MAEPQQPDFDFIDLSTLADPPTPSSLLTGPPLGGRGNGANVVSPPTPTLSHLNLAGAAAAALGGLAAMSESEAAKVIAQAVAIRPSMALPVVNAICPELTFAPAKALTERRMTGRIKSFNHSNGYGFISCQEVFQSFGSDVFLHRAQVGSFVVDQQVSFAVLLNKYNRPQAFDLAPILSSSGMPLSSTPGAASVAVASGAVLAGTVPPSPPPLPGTLAPQMLGNSAGDVEAAAAVAAVALAIAGDMVVEWRKRRWQWQLCGDGGAAWGQGQKQGTGFWATTVASAAAVAALASSSGARGTGGAGTPGRFRGRLKSFSAFSGFGFIECAELFAEFGRDVFVHHAHVNGCRVGTEVAFRLFFNAKGQPQAQDVEEAHASSSSTAPAPSSKDPSAEAASAETTGADGSSTAAAGSAEDVVPAARPGGDSLLDGATCVICQEVLYRATSIQPCLHSFCSACLGSWLWASSSGVPQCPVCREMVVRVTRNHTLDGLIEGLLKIHPERRRSDEDVVELNSRDVLQEAGYDLGVLHARRRSIARSARVGQSGSRGDRSRGRIWRNSYMRDRRPSTAAAMWLGELQANFAAATGGVMWDPDAAEEVVLRNNYGIPIHDENPWAELADPEDEPVSWWDLSDDDGGWSDASDGPLGGGYFAPPPQNLNMVSLAAARPGAYAI